MRGWFGPLAALLTMTLSCAESTAIVTRPNGPPLEGEIDSSDATTLRLRGPDGSLVTLDQPGVSEIDHPGNVWAALGLGVAAGSTLFLLPILLPPSQKDGRPDGFQGLGLFLGLGGIVEGLTIFAYNTTIWGRSRWRARAFERARPPDWLIPPAAGGAPIPIVPLSVAPQPDGEASGTTPPSSTFHR
jgi:hypothetical protein